MNREPEKLIWITTSRYSAVFRTILSSYRNDVSIKVNGLNCTADDLISDWCKNSKIKGTRDFELWSQGRHIFGFHDGPANFWAQPSELSFVDDLKQKKLVRYQVLSKAK